MMPARRFILGLIVAVLGIAVVASKQAVADSGPAAAPPRGPDAQQQLCGSCHTQEYMDWVNSKHANSTLVPEQHKDWGAGPMPETCKFCHPQGIDPVAGKTVTTGVTCVSCHGAYSDDHPPAIMPIRRTTELCGSCHSATYHEWRSSGHGQQGITCVSCHSVHSQATRAAGGQYLCLSCHAERFHDFLSTAHGQAQLTCVRCHLGNRPHDVEGIRTSFRVSPSHTFVARIEICMECHQDSIHNRQVVLTPGAQTAGQQPVGTPQAGPTSEVTPVPVPPMANPAGTLDLTWAGGALAGLMLGFAVAWVTIRGRQP